MRLHSTNSAISTLQLLQIAGRSLLRMSHRFKLSPSAVRAAIQSFPNGSAARPDGLRPQHLKDLLLGAWCARRQSTDVTDLTNLLLEGKTPPSVRVALFGANLLAVRKINGGIRPIAVGYV